MKGRAEERGGLEEGEGRRKGKLTYRLNPHAHTPRKQIPVKPYISDLSVCLPALLRHPLPCSLP